MTTMELVGIRSGVSLREKDGMVTLAAAHVQLNCGAISAGLRGALDLLLERPASRDEILDQAVAADGFIAGPYVTYLLRQIEQAGLLSRTIVTEAGPLATVVPLGVHAKRIDVRLVPEARYVLCRFALLRSDQGRLVLESPRSHFRIELHTAAAAAPILAFAAPCRPLDVEGATQAEPLLDALVATGFLTDADAPPPDSLSTWEFHDLLFHMRSRLGRQDRPYGGTYRFDGLLRPHPAVKEMRGEEIALPVPNLEDAARREPSFVEVLETRRSIRRQGANPLSLAQLGELLFRSLRVRRVVPGTNGDLSSRPYPGGGAVYELEVYPVLDRIEGCPSGLYHYCPARHLLTRMSDRSRAVEQLLESAFATINRESRPQVLLVLAARFGRVTMKYESMAYALILKDVGVLYQTLYLVSTAMGLAPCALGGGDSELFAAASGIDPLVEGAVGEFVVGTRWSEETP